MIELLVVMAIFSLMLMIAAPRISSFLGNERQDSGLLVAYVAAVADNAFVSGNKNYLCISLNKKGSKNNELFGNPDFTSNSVSVYNLENLKLVENQTRIIQQRTFTNSFIIQNVYLEGSGPVSEGEVVIPFYTDGTSEGFTIEVMYDGKSRFFKKYKNSKELRIMDELQS